MNIFNIDTLITPRSVYSNNSENASDKCLLWLFVNRIRKNLRPQSEKDAALRHRRVVLFISIKYLRRFFVLCGIIKTHERDFAFGLSVI